MRGEYFTKAGLASYLIGIVVLIVWIAVYEGEHEIIPDGRLQRQSEGSKVLLGIGLGFSILGFFLCLIGYSVSSDTLKYSIKVRKSNFLES